MYIDDLPIWGLYSYLLCCTWSFFYFLNNCVRPHPILIIFGMHLPEWICNKMAVFLLTSCSVCVMICLWPQYTMTNWRFGARFKCLKRTFAFGFDVHALRLHRCRISHLLLLVLEWLLQLISWSHWLLMKTNIPLHACWLLISCGLGLHYQWHCWIMWLQRKPGTFTLNVYFDILLHKCQLVLTESFHYCICEQSDVCHISQGSVRTPVWAFLFHFCCKFGYLPDKNYQNRSWFDKVTEKITMLPSFFCPLCIYKIEYCYYAKHVTR